MENNNNPTTNHPTIVYAIPYLDETGQMRAPYQICKGFLERGWSVFIEALNRTENAGINVVWDRVIVKKIDGINKKHRMFNYVINFLRKRDQEIVISWVWYWHCFSLLFSKLLFKNPYVIVLDSYTYLGPWDKKGRLSKLRLKLRYGLILKFADVIIAETALSYEHLERNIHGPKKLFIPICFWRKDLDRIEKMWVEDGFDPQRELVILYAGQITERKRIHQLIEAFSHLSGIFPDWKVEIRGPVTDQKYLGTLKKLVMKYNLNQKVQFLPALSGERLYRRYRATSIYCLPSVFEGVPTTILEAMYFGGAIIAADSGHIQYQINNGDCGLLFEPGDINTLAEHLKHLMQSEVERYKFITKSRERVLREFIWERYFDQLEVYLRGLV